MPPNPQSSFSSGMCRSRRSILASEPKPAAAMRQPASASPSNNSSATATINNNNNNNNNNNASSSSTTVTATTSVATTTTTSSSISSRLSLSISETATLYPFTEIAAATNNFLSKRLLSSSVWRCSLRGKDVVIFQRACHGNPANIPSRLSTLCKSHHSSLVDLVGASVGGGYIYLVYKYTAGASLEECLRNSRSPSFTPLSKWISRMQVAADVAQGLDYIHVHCDTIHNRIKSSSIIVTEPLFNAKICHFGAADLAGEIPLPVVSVEEKNKKVEEEIEEEEEEEQVMMRRRKSDVGRFEGTRGYIAPEVIEGGGRLVSQKSDVFAFGVVLLELISGREPLKYRLKKKKEKGNGGEYERISLIETGRDAIGMTEDEEGGGGLEMEVEENRRGRIRQWVDRRLRDSFPVEVVEKLMRVALRCVEEQAFMRPDMTWVAGKVSKLFLDSKVWDDSVGVPADFSVTYGPR